MWPAVYYDRRLLEEVREAGCGLLPSDGSQSLIAVSPLAAQRSTIDDPETHMPPFAD
jgi:hypothetical protein